MSDTYPEYHAPVYRHHIKERTRIGMHSTEGGCHLIDWRKAILDLYAGGYTLKEIARFSHKSLIVVAQVVGGLTRSRMNPPKKKVGRPPKIKPEIKVEEKLEKKVG